MEYNIVKALRAEQTPMTGDAADLIESLFINLNTALISICGECLKHASETDAEPACDICEFGIIKLRRNEFFKAWRDELGEG